MKIIQITPGSGGNFYCENCLRDAVLVQAWRTLGHDAVVVPLYLPLDMDKAFSSAPHKIYFGGINVYLQQKYALFRKLPAWLDRLFDSPVLLRMAAKRAGMVDAHQLAETTISILQGQHGRQVKELNRLVSFLSHNQTPDIICLSNIMLSGLAESIKQKLHVPVVCLLQDEDEFLDIMPEPWRTQAWDILRDNTKYIDCCIAVSQYYADFMAYRLNLNNDKLKVCYMGIAQPDNIQDDIQSNMQSSDVNAQVNDGNTQGNAQSNTHNAQGNKSGNMLANRSDGTLGNVSDDIADKIHNGVMPPLIAKYSVGVDNAVVPNIPANVSAGLPTDVPADMVANGPADVPTEVPVIGYLSRMCPEKGLDVLVDAFIILKDDTLLSRLKLRVAGGHTKDDEPFIARITQKLQQAGYLEDVEFIDGFDAETRRDFFRSITLLSVPEKRGPACAMYALEALAQAVPIVQPPVGVFNELHDMIGPAVCLSASPEASDLAQAMRPLLSCSAVARRWGLAGRNMVRKNFNIDNSARRMINIFEGQVV